MVSQRAVKHESIGERTHLLRLLSPRQQHDLQLAKDTNIAGAYAYCSAI
jgi:hypothetical protein